MHPNLFYFYRFLKSVNVYLIFILVYVIKALLTAHHRDYSLGVRIQVLKVLNVKSMPYRI